MCDRFPRKFGVQTSYKPFAMNIKFPRATYHTIVPSIEELYCLNNALLMCRRLELLNTLVSIGMKA